MGQVVRDDSISELAVRRKLTLHEFDAHRIVFFADERLVPLDDPESNYRIVNEGLFSKVPIQPENIHAIETEYLDDPEELSHDYEKQLMNQFAGGSSDLSAAL